MKDAKRDDKPADEPASESADIMLPEKDENGVPYLYQIMIYVGEKKTTATVYRFRDSGYLVRHGLTDTQKGIDTNAPGMTEKLGKTLLANMKELLSEKSFAKIDLDAKTVGEWIQKQTEVSPTVLLLPEDKLGDLPQIFTKPEWTFECDVGISSFFTDESDIQEDACADFTKEMTKLRRQDSMVIGFNVFVSDTLREFPMEKERKILDIIKERLRVLGGYFEWLYYYDIRILGEEEALFKWIGSNYATGNIKKQPNGILELKEDHAKLCISTKKYEIEEYWNSMYTVILTTLGSKASLEYEVFVSSVPHRSFGKAHLQQQLRLAESEKSGSTTLVDPCLPSGYRTDLKLDNTKYEVTGISNFEECLTEIRNHLAQKSPGIETGSVHGVSDFSTLKGKYSYAEFEAETKKVCSLDWTKGADIEQCFKSAFTLSLLHDQLQIDELAFEENAEKDWQTGMVFLMASDANEVGFLKVERYLMITMLQAFYKDQPSIASELSEEIISRLYSSDLHTKRAGYYRNADPEKLTRSDYNLMFTDADNLPLWYDYDEQIPLRYRIQDIATSPPAISGMVVLVFLCTCAFFMRKDIAKFLVRMYNKLQAQIARIRHRQHHRLNSVETVGDTDLQMEPL